MGVESVPFGLVALYLSCHAERKDLLGRVCQLIGWYDGAHNDRYQWVVGQFFS